MGVDELDAEELPEKCLNNCIYTPTGSSEPKFCFARGDLPVACRENPPPTNIPETAVPDTTIPETTIPDTIPDQTRPDTTPNTTVPRTTPYHEDANWGECRGVTTGGLSIVTEVVEDNCTFPGVAKTGYWPFSDHSQGLDLHTCCYCCYNDWCSKSTESGCVTEEAMWWDDLKQKLDNQT